MKNYSSEIYRVRMQNALHKYLPEAAVPYCFSLWEQQPFSFKIKNPRLSKAGDYTYIPTEKLHVITVNRNLNSYNFLITFIHEVAHMVAFENYGRKISPHGKEWKTTFAHLMQPLLKAEIFPKELLPILYRHFKNPKASTSGDPALVKALNEYNEDDPSGLQILDEIINGEYFVFRKKTYQKIEKRRTRVLCREKKSGRHFLISKAAMVTPPKE